MLYITTRSDNDTYTSHRALSNDTAPDGGHFVPFKMNRFSKQQIAALKDRSFNQNLADLLNLFFTAGLTAWDVDFAIGKNPSAIHPMNHRILVSELWRNPGSGFDYSILRLYEKLCAGKSADKLPGTWAKESIRIAFIFAVYAQLLQHRLLSEDDEFDIVVSAEDFLMPMAVWRARSMGLPVNTIICACDESCNVWDLIHKGTYATSSGNDALLLGVEKLVHAAFNVKEARAFADICKNKATYTLDEEASMVLSKGFYCTVAGHGRANTTVNSVYRSNHYVMDPTAALCFSSLQDYRAGTGISRVALLFAEISPMNAKEQIVKATGLSERDLREMIHL